MSGPALDAAKLGLAVLLILANAFFVSAEFALVSLRRTRVDELVAEGNATARIVRRVIRDPDRLIATTQLGITVASLGLGWIGEPALANLIEPLFRILPSAWVSPATEAIATGIIAFALITFLDVVVGELMPKSIAIGYPEQTALIVSRPTILFESLFQPATWALNKVGSALLTGLGLERPSGRQQVHSVQELKLIVSASAASGELEPVEREMAHRAFEFAGRKVEEVMIPRTALVAIQDTASIADVLQVFDRASHSRFPVYSENMDNLVGFVWIKDVLRALARDPGASAKNVKTLIRNPLFVPGSKQIGGLFAEMQRQKIQLAIVIDEYGGTAGMVTMEEMVEEIVGRISDELTTSPPPLRHVDESNIEASASLRVEEINEQLGLKLAESESYETLAGYILEQLKRLPREREVIPAGNVQLMVLAMKGPKIERVLITRPRKKGPS